MHDLRLLCVTTRLTLLSNFHQGDKAIVTCRFINQFHHRCDFEILSEIPPANQITIDIVRKLFD